MRRLLWIGLLVAFLMPAATIAQDAISGTWKTDLSNPQLPKKPDVYQLKDGMYTCKTCAPPFEVKADGQDQKVSGHPYFDTLSVKVVDDRTVEMSQKKDGKLNGTSKMMVSPDGKTMVFEFSDSSATNGDPVTGKIEATRVGKAPAGEHAISGSWRTTKYDTISDNGLVVTFKLDGDTLMMSSPTGQSYAAKLDGTEAPYKGDPGTTSVSVKKMGKDTIEETDKRDGKVIGVTRMKVSADGKTMTFDNVDKLHGTTSQFTATKQ
ncbi:MAG: hypothetical protein WCE52_07090 [Candidatus Acidiferrum sp.]